jgi:hypothetical protein
MLIRPKDSDRPTAARIRARTRASTAAEARTPWAPRRPRCRWPHPADTYPHFAGVLRFAAVALALGWQYSSRSRREGRPRARRAAPMRTANRELPPRSKKPSSGSTGTPGTSAQISHRMRVRSSSVVARSGSGGVAGPRCTCGGGVATRRALPLGVSGSLSRAVTVAGSLYSGRTFAARSRTVAGSPPGDSATYASIRAVAASDGSSSVDDGGRTDVGVLQQDGTDLVEFDAEAADLDLAVDLPEVFETPVRAQPAQVAAAVHGAAGERVRHEPPGRQLLLAQVSERHAGPADADLARHARRQQPASSSLTHRCQPGRARPTERVAVGASVRVSVGGRLAVRADGVDAYLRAAESPRRRAAAGRSAAAPRAGPGRTWWPGPARRGAGGMAGARRRE